MTADESHDITELLARMGAGDPNAIRDLMPLVYDELRRRARILVEQERTGYSVPPTAVADEVLEQFIGKPCHTFVSREAFFRAVTNRMRNLLVDHARHRRAKKRGGSWNRIELSPQMTLSAEEPDHAMALHESLSRFEDVFPEKAAVMEARYFGGLGLREAAVVVGCSYAQAERYCAFALAWLRTDLRRE